MVKIKYTVIKTGSEESVSMSRRHIMHGGCGSRLYRIWGNMKGRCYCKSRREYKNYGNRGIKILGLGFLIMYKNTT